MAQDRGGRGVQQRPRRPATQRPRGHAAQARLEQQRRRRRLVVSAITVAVVAIIAVIVAVQSQTTSSSNGKALTIASDYNPSQQYLPVGSVAPNFNLPGNDGKHYTLSQFRGKTVLLEFYAVWCPVCQAEAPTINQIDSAFKGKNYQSLSILSNPYGKDYEKTGSLRLADASDVAWFQQTFHVNHPFLYDPTFATVNHYGVHSYPTIYIVDPKGVIRFAQAGELPYSQLASAITAAQRS
jgi:thiol-disulfide isomerase/thioredoxin